MLSREEFRKTIDHTALKPWVKRDEVARLCEEARERGFASVCVNSYWVSLAARLLDGSGVSVGTTAGFPLGSCSSATKAFEAAEAIRAGASEVDVVINVGLLKDCDDGGVLADIQGVVHAVRDEAARKGIEAVVKVIIEACSLSRDEKARAARLVVRSGADFVKTSTGFGAGGATVDDVRLLKEAIAGGCRIKAAGGIKTLRQALDLIDAGASRIGTSNGIGLDDEMGHSAGWIAGPNGSGRHGDEG